VFTTAPPEHPSSPLTTPNTTPSLTTINEIDNVSSSSPFNASVLTTSLTSISSAYLNTSTSTYMQSTTSAVTTSGPDSKSLNLYLFVHIRTYWGKCEVGAP
jgi:hypothetical protein